MTGGLLLYVWVNNIEIIWNNERIINRHRDIGP